MFVVPKSPHQDPIPLKRDIVEELWNQPKFAHYLSLILMHGLSKTSCVIYIWPSLKNELNIWHTLIFDLRKGMWIPFYFLTTFSRQCFIKINSRNCKQTFFIFFFSNVRHFIEGEYLINLLLLIFKKNSFKK